MKNKLIALIEVRKIISLLAMLLFVVLALRGTLQIDFIQMVIIAIVSFYFGKPNKINE